MVCTLSASTPFFPNLQALTSLPVIGPPVLGNNAEPLESVRLVEVYRRYLKPKAVRVVLLAESHVFTSDEDRRIAIPPIDDMPGYPTQYARFVSCLGNGKRNLTNDPHYPRADGTLQFWKILYACNNRIENLEDFRPVQRGMSFPQRLQNKIHLLKNPREKGIWLAAASIVAVYGSGVNFSRRGWIDVLREPRESYTKSLNYLHFTPKMPVVCTGFAVRTVSLPLVPIIARYRYRAEGRIRTPTGLPTTPCIKPQFCKKCASCRIRFEYNIVRILELKRSGLGNCMPN
jgi:hypothetical protein